MKSSRQAGALNVLLVPLVLVIMMLIGVSIFAYQYYLQAQDYKNNVDQKIAVAVEDAKAKLNEQKDKDFAEKEKYPYDTYIGPAAAGSLRIQYPKTWSAYVVAPEGRNTNKPVDGYFYPGQVPSVSDENNSYALRVLVIQQTYDSILKTYQSNQKAGKVSIQPYQSPNVPGIVGARLDGEVQQKKQGSMILLPFRDKTLQLWTESTEYRGDFDDIILKNFTLTP